MLRVVSFHADDTNRSPTFDMDLSELLRDGQPISYSEARTYFKSDPATRSVTCPVQFNDINNYDAVLAKRRQVRATQVNSLQTGLF